MGAVVKISVTIVQWENDFIIILEIDFCVQNQSIFKVSCPNEVFVAALNRDNQLECI